MSCSLECKLQVRAFVLFISVSAAPKTMPTTGVVLNKSLSNEWMHKSYNFTIEKYFSANICHYDFTSHFPAVILLTKQFTINRESIKKASFNSKKSSILCRFLNALAKNCTEFLTQFNLPWICIYIFFQCLIKFISIFSFSRWSIPKSCLFHSFFFKQVLFLLVFTFISFYLN